MGTNYYAIGDTVPCNTCDDLCLRDTACGLHVGKSSAGWVILFRAYPELGIESVADWRRWFAEADGARGLRDEYGCSRDVVAFFDDARTRLTIEHPAGGSLNRGGDLRSYTDAEGYDLTGRAFS